MRNTFILIVELALLSFEETRNLFVMFTLITESRQTEAVLLRPMVPGASHHSKRL